MILHLKKADASWVVFTCGSISCKGTYLALHAHFYAPRRISGEHKVAALSVRPKLICIITLKFMNQTKSNLVHLTSTKKQSVLHMNNNSY